MQEDKSDLIRILPSLIGIGEDCGSCLDKRRFESATKLKYEMLAPPRTTSWDMPKIAKTFEKTQKSSGFMQSENTESVGIGI